MNGSNDTNGTNSTTNGDAARPLKIVVVGAGIGGLYAAIALQKAGHAVEIYESSRFAQEIGAAIHLPPNVNGLLQRYGMIASEHGAVTCEWVSEYRPNGERVFLRDTSGLRRLFPYPWQLCHRIDLHNALKKIATGLGVQIILQSRVKEVDCEAAEILLADGRKVVGDLVLGADGTHSALRKYVVGAECTSKPSGSSAFRFLLPTSAVKADSVTAHFAERNGELQLLYGNNRRIVIYPCRNNTELNFVGLHPDEESESTGETYNQSASKETVLKVYSDYPDDVKALLAKIDPDTIKLWKLLDLPTLPTWTKGRVALLGDAAHPFLPHQGQGGAQAIEDAAALGALLPIGTLVSEIEDRLKLYMEARFERATTVQQYSRDSAFKTKRGDHGGKVMDPMQFTGFNFDHDAYDHASGILRRHLASKAMYKRMPLSFGPCPGPKQCLDGKPRLGLNGSVEYHTTYVTFKTKKSYLSTLLPSSDLKILSQSGWTTATFSITRLGNLKWLGGRGYSHFGLYIHNVAHAGTVSGFSMKNENAEKSGDFLPVLFENMADPIITGREELGFSKVFATLEGKQTANSYEVKAGWEGTDFCNITLTDLVQQESVIAALDPPLYHCKVVPSSNEAMKVDAEYITVSQLQLVKNAVEKRWAGKAKIKFTELEGNDLEMAFPTLANIISGLRSIDVDEVIASGIRSYP